MKKQKHAIIKSNCGGLDSVSIHARKFFESKGLVDGEINATRISLIIRAKQYNLEFDKTYKKLYPLLTLNGQKWCDDLLKKVRVRKKKK